MAWQQFNHLGNSYQSLIISLNYWNTRCERLHSNNEKRTKKKKQNKTMGAKNFRDLKQFEILRLHYSFYLVLCEKFSKTSSTSLTWLQMEHWTSWSTYYNDCLLLNSLSDVTCRSSFNMYIAWKLFIFAQILYSADDFSLINIFMLLCTGIFTLQ